MMKAYTQMGSETRDPHRRLHQTNSAREAKKKESFAPKREREPMMMMMPLKGQSVMQFASRLLSWQRSTGAPVSSRHLLCSL